MGMFVALGRLEKAVPKERRGARRLRVWIQTAPIIFETVYRGTRKRYTVGIGARGDGASADWWQRIIIALLAGGRARPAFQLHDVLCQSHDIDKVEADQVLNDALAAVRCPGWLRRAIMRSVRQSAIRNNWPQPDLTPILRADGLPGWFAECPIEIVNGSISAPAGLFQHSVQVDAVLE